MKVNFVRVMPIPNSDFQALLHVVQGEKMGITIRKFKYSLVRFCKENNYAYPTNISDCERDYNIFKAYLEDIGYDLDATYKNFLENNLEQVTNK